MRHVMIRYKVKPGRAEENEELVRAVFDELARTEPAGLRYATYRLDDGVTFVHVSASDGPSPLTDVEAFKRFQRDIADRVEDGPVVTEVTQIGAYRS
jgi:hypothetical protein